MKRTAWKFLIAAGAVLTIFAACQINEVECNQVCKDNWMDGPTVNDTSLIDTVHRYQVSLRKDSLSDSLKAVIPVIITAHGYTASTFEWLEFRQFTGDTLAYVMNRSDSLENPKVLTSLVLLGGHGVNIEDFQKSTWQDWGKPILEEYEALVAKGYKNISIAGSSTGCPLILDHISRGRLNSQPPNQIFLIDPIITPSAKMLSLIGIMGPILGNSPSEGGPEELAHWYNQRPAETLDELYSLTNLIKNRLEKGFKLPPGTQAKVWKAKKDALADPIGALILYKGLRTSDNGRIEVEMVETAKHVFTRLLGRTSEPTSQDINNKRDAFEEMVLKAKDL